MNEILRTLVEWMGVIAVTLILALSPALQRRRPLKFVYPRREALVALSLVALITALLAVIFSLSSQPAPQPGSTPSAGVQSVAPAAFTYTLPRLGNQVGLAAIIALPFALALLIRRQPPLSAGLGKANAKAGIQLGVALALISIFLSGKTYTVLNGLSLSQGLYFAAMLVVGFTEEFIFRGYIQPRLMSWLGDNRGWLLTAGIFSLWHLPQKLLVERVAGPDLLINLAVLFVFGLVLGWVMRKSGSILAPGLYHAVHNWLMVL